MHSVRSVTISGCLLVGNKSVSFDHEQLFKMIPLNQKRQFLLASSPNIMASKDLDNQDVYGHIPQIVLLFQNTKRKTPKHALTNHENKTDHFSYKKTRVLAGTIK